MLWSSFFFIIRQLSFKFDQIIVFEFIELFLDILNAFFFYCVDLDRFFNVCWDIINIRLYFFFIFFVLWNLWMHFQRYLFRRFLFDFKIGLNRMLRNSHISSWKSLLMTNRLAIRVIRSLNSWVFFPISVLLEPLKFFLTWVWGLANFWKRSPSIFLKVVYKILVIKHTFLKPLLQNTLSESFSFLHSKLLPQFFIIRFSINICSVFINLLFIFRFVDHCFLSGSFFCVFQVKSIFYFCFISSSKDLGWLNYNIQLFNFLNRFQFLCQLLFVFLIFVKIFVFKFVLAKVSVLLNFIEKIIWLSFFLLFHLNTQLLKVLHLLLNQRILKVNIWKHFILCFYFRFLLFLAFTLWRSHPVVNLPNIIFICVFVQKFIDLAILSKLRSTFFILRRYFCSFFCLPFLFFLALLFK